MQTPRFLRLAQIDDRRSITACRHGLVHLSWGRTTVRFARDEFRQLAKLLQRARANQLPATIHDGELRITAYHDRECELQIGTLVLLLAPTEFEALVQAVEEAIHNLDRILASGMWDRQEPEDAPPGPVEQIRRNPFSKN